MPIVSKTIEMQDDKKIRNGDAQEEFARFIANENIGFTFDKRIETKSYLIHEGLGITLEVGSSGSTLQFIIKKGINQIALGSMSQGGSDYSFKLWILYTKDKKNITFFLGNATNIYDELPGNSGSSSRFGILNAYDFLEKMELNFSHNYSNITCISDTLPTYFINKIYNLSTMGNTQTPPVELKEYAYVSEYIVTEIPIRFNGIKCITFRNSIGNRLYKIGEENYYCASVDGRFYNY